MIIEMTMINKETQLISMKDDINIQSDFLRKLYQKHITKMTTT